MLTFVIGVLIGSQIGIALMAIMQLSKDHHDPDGPQAAPLVGAPSVVSAGGSRVDLMLR